MGKGIGGRRRKVPLIVRAYGLFCLLYGIFDFLLMVVLAAAFGLMLSSGSDALLQEFGGHVTLTLILFAVSALLKLVTSVALVVFGRDLLTSRRRNAALWARGLIVLTIVEILVEIMLAGIDFQLARPVVQLLVLVALSVTIDPTLRAERQAERASEDAEERATAEVGMLGRDLTGKGFLRLDFFNLFWTFVVCCTIGLVLEVVWHMVVVDPGVYQDRAGLLFGPFSPIYGFGALIMTVALNRLYDKNPLAVFLASAVIGGLFEAAVSLFMQIGFGAVAWDYSGAMLFGVVADPVAELFGGRTSTLFAGIWGLLGLAWIKLLLPVLLRLINLIPWRLRYGLTTICALLMLVNGVMTLEALDCWYERLSGIQPSSPVEEFYAERYDNDFMQRRFQSMTITPESSGRADGGARD